MLIGNLVVLRPLRAEDLPLTLEWRNTMFVKTSTCSHPFPITREQEENWYQRILKSTDARRIYFMICEKQTMREIGYVFLDDLDWINRRCYWGATLGKEEFTGKGFGREAVMLIIDYAFRNLNMHKVLANVLSDNGALHTWVHTGAVIEGTLKEHVFNDGKYKDMNILAWYERAIS